jgi:hypothetical protein
MVNIQKLINENKPLRKALGYILILFAVAGFIFGIIGLIGVWEIRSRITTAINENLSLLDRTLTTTQDGLKTIAEMTAATHKDVTSLINTTQALAQAIRDAGPSLDALSNLTSKDLPATISATQTSLASAQNSALLIDNLLTTLTSIPLLPLAPYRPTVPLHTALGQVSDSLNALTPSLSKINSSLLTSKTNLANLQDEISKISETTKGISSSFDSTQAIIAQYQSANAQIKSQVVSAQKTAPEIILGSALVLSFFLVWFLIAQIGLGLQGLALISTSTDPLSNRGDVAA